MAADQLRRVTGGIRFRITAVATVVVAVVLVATGTLSVVAQRRALTDRVDEQLEQRADDVTGLVERGTADQALAVEGGDEALTQIVAVDGEVTAASANIEDEPPLVDLPSTAGQRFQTVDAPFEDDEFRLLSRRVDAPGGAYVLVVGVAFDDVAESVAVLTRTILLVFPVVLVIVALLIWVVVNAMLNRVDEAHRRQRRFVGDASHELRTPLTTMRSELEVDLTHPESADLLATHRSVLEETTRLQRLVDDLLYLARSDDGVAPSRSATVDLDEIVLREADALRARGSVAVDTRQVSGAQVTGDAYELARAVRNLLDNAGRHATSRVTLALGERDDGANLVITDDGPGVPSDQADRIFERFARLDDARRRDEGGAGLGLAITHDIVVGHRGTVTLARDVGAGATFVVRLPLATRRAPPER
ncbi:MAG: sensor histidine kinase [Acidimicrobiia bacterium]